ncbi:MAG: ATP-binding protein [Proteobacteria bacterium]|jgi:signal transduction histidine kinase/ActR/RegA family two-component response regulator|nr:ATP-binding protein [Pseudomonadota bacterium]
MAQLHVVLLVLGFSASLFLAALLLAYDWRARTNYSLRLLMLDGALWSLLGLVLYLPISLGHEVAIVRLSGLFLIVVPPLLLDFAYAFRGRRRDVIWFAVAVVSVAVVAIYVATDKGVASVARGPDGMVIVEDGDWIVFCKGLTALTLAVASWIMVRGVMGARDPALRNALLTIAIGALLSVAFIACGELASQSLSGRSFPFVSSSFLILIPFVSVAIFRHGFLSVDIAKIAADLFGNARDGIAILDRYDRVRQMNPAAIALIGLKGDVFSGARAAAIVPGWQEIAERSSAEVTVAGSGGAARSLSLSASTPTRGGKRLGRIIIIRDVTDKIRAKEALSRSRAELEAEVEHRTAELQRIQRMEAMGALTGSIAHDFNNLLAAIIGFATAARDDLPERHAIRRDLDEVLFAARRARETVSQLLAFGRQGVERREPLEVGGFLDGTLSFVEASLPVPISLRRALQSEKMYVMGDATQLHQVIVNLTTNAVQTIGPRKGTITVSTALLHLGADAGSARRSIEPGESVVITVTDDGPGIRRGDLDRVFDPFFVATNRGEGTGLGLPTALRIAQDHGGTITVDSDEGKGASFSVYLPLIDPPCGRDALESPNPTGSEHVLLVEGDPPSRRRTRRLLVSLGYRVTAHSSFDAALADYRGTPGAFDAVIAAAEIAGRSGLDLAGLLLEERPNARILLTCGGPTPELSDAAGRLGVFVMAERESAPEELAAALRRLIDATKDRTSQPPR